MSDDHKREDDEPIEGRIPDHPEDGDFDDGFEGEPDERDTRGGKQLVSMVSGSGDLSVCDLTWETLLQLEKEGRRQRLAVNRWWALGHVVREWPEIPVPFLEIYLSLELLALLGTHWRPTCG